MKKVQKNLAMATLLGLLTLLTIGSTYTFAQDTVKETEQLDFAKGLLSRGMYDMAIAQFQKYIADYPQSPALQDAYLSLGEAYFLSQDLDKATSTFEQFDQLYPHSDKLPASILRLGQIDIQQKKYTEALKELTSIDIEKQLKGPMLQSFDYYIAQAFAASGNTASALDLYQKAAQVEGATDYTANAFEEIGKIDAANGHYSDALDAYAKSMQLAGDDALKAELTYRIAETQFLSGNYAEAIKGFGETVEKYPDSSFAQNAMANMLLTYYNLGQYDQLLKAYQQNTKKIKDDGAYFEVHFTAVLAYIELKQYDQANSLLDHLAAIPTIKPQQRTKAFIKKADILIREKKFKEGLSLLAAHSAESPDDADEKLFLEGQGYFGLGEFDRAYNYFENVYLNFPDSRFYNAALLGLAHARKATGRYKESAILFLKFVDTKAASDLKNEALYDAVMMSAKAGDLNETIKSATDYLKVNPGTDQYSEVLLILADAYDKNNQPQEAVNLLQGYLAKPETVLRPNSAYFLLGFNEELLGKKDQALAAYIAVDQHKENGEYYAAALKNIAVIYLNQKNFDQASVYFSRLINQSDQNDLQLKTYIWVCNEYLKKQDYEEVLRIANQAEKHFALKDLLQIKYFKAEALRARGNCDEAVKNYGVVIASADKDAFTGSAHIGNGLCLEVSGKLDEAKKEFQSALDENAEDYTVTVHARFEMANLEESQGNLEDAQKIFLLIATIYEDDHFCSESLLRAARIAERLKHKADALKMYAEILDKYKNSPAASTAKKRVLELK